MFFEIKNYDLFSLHIYFHIDILKDIIILDQFNI
jgi:hypothetical protein